MRHLFDTLVFLFLFSMPLLSQRAEDFMWRVQGVDTLPSWVTSPHEGEFGVSLPEIDSTLAQSQSIAHAAINHLLHNGISANSVEENYFRENNLEVVPNKTQRMIKSEIDFRFDYHIRNTHTSPFGEKFNLVTITPSSQGACRIYGDLTLYYNYQFTNIDNWKAYYLLSLNIEGLDSLKEEKIEMYRVQYQSEINTTINGRPWSRMGVYCTYEDVNDTISIAHDPEQWLVKGFWNPYFFMQLNSVFYEIGSPSVIKSLAEHYTKNGRDEYQELSRHVSRINIFVETEVLGVVDNNLKIKSTVRQN